jgi:uncharacterized membrane protein
MKKGKIINVLLILGIGMLNLVACVKNDAREAPVVVNPCAGTPGPLFTAVKTLIETRCVGCHNANRVNGGMNWTVDCNIVTNKGRIKVRAVDEGTMPPNGPLPAADKAKITNWINAGGRITD